MDICEHLSGRTDVFLHFKSASQAIIDTSHPFAFGSELVALSRHRSPMVVACRESTRVYQQNYDDFIRFMELDPAFKPHFCQISFETLYYQINATIVPQRGPTS
jgi:hypothetical protein